MIRFHFFTPCSIVFKLYLKRFRIGLHVGVMDRYDPETTYLSSVRQVGISCFVGNHAEGSLPGINYWKTIKKLP